MENTLDYVDNFISMDLNAIEYIIKLELLRDCCIKKRNGTDHALTICRQINEIRKIITEGVNKL